MSKAIGIDLGTTFTCVAYMKNDEVEVVSNHHGNKITPSVVNYGVGITNVGEKAVALRGSDPKNTVFQVKRFMGREAEDPEIKRRTYPFEIVASKKKNANIRVTPMNKGVKGESQTYCPEQISSDILSYAKKIAELNIGHEVTKAVITVPANFTNDQREATKYAGEIAGLEVLRILNEPTAAALAYGLERKNMNESRIVLVYDLGGGTFDVSIVKIKGTEAEVLSTHGLTYLGGEDFDYRLYEEAVAQFKKMGIDISKDREFATLQSCELAKRTLSTCESAEIETFDSKGTLRSIKISREEFEELCQDLFERTIGCVKEAIKESKCSMDVIDDIVLVGGSSRIPRLQHLLQKLFGEKKLKFDIPPDHAVAHGAAILADCLADTSNLPVKSSGGAVKLIDVTPFSLGVGMVLDRMGILIRKNTRYPANGFDMLYNAFDNATSLRFTIFEGENVVASENNLLGELNICVPMRPSGQNKMETTFAIDANGILNVHVKDKDTGKEAQTTVITSKLSPEERAKMKNDSKKRHENEAVLQAKIEARKAFTEALTRANTWLTRVSDTQKQKAIEVLIEREQKWFNSKDQCNSDLLDHAKSIRKSLSELVN